jgi:SNF2 family DNA or RNA helicase
VILFHGGKAKRDKALNSIRKKGGVCITTYGMPNPFLFSRFYFQSTNARCSFAGLVLTCAETLSEVAWSYIILDEGHKIRNHNATTSKALSQVHGKHKIVISGTPIMNNYRVCFFIFFVRHIPEVYLVPFSPSPSSFLINA